MRSRPSIKTLLGSSALLVAWLASAINATTPTFKPPAGRAYTDLDIGSGVKMHFVYIPSGTFQMGSPPTEPNRQEGPPVCDETQHEVTISKGFWMSMYETDQKQWQLIMGSNPSGKKDTANPVETVTRNDAISFCQQVSRRTGQRLRLPTEAEWEYACRAGSTGRFCYGDDPTSMGVYAWFDQGDAGYNNARPVGKRMPSKWGLYDIHGNVWEFVSDWYANYPTGPVTDPTGPANSTGSETFRGGCVVNWYGVLRAAFRHIGSIDFTNSVIGFRAVMEADKAPVEVLKPVEYRVLDVGDNRPAAGLGWRSVDLAGRLAGSLGAQAGEGIRIPAATHAADIPARRRASVGW